MRKSIQLSVAKPCSESWDMMSPEHQGRFCSSCNKTVVDFAAMTDKQLLGWLARHQGPVCGRLRQDQLLRPLTAEPPQKTPIAARYWHWLVAMLLSSSDLAAQTHRAKPPTIQQIPVHAQDLVILGDTIMNSKPKPPTDRLQGRVVGADGNPVNYATVKSNEKHGVVTDAEGYFSIPPAILAGSRTLTITAVGYEPIKVDVKKFRQDGQVQTIPMVLMQLTMQGEMVVVRTRRKKPLADTLTKIKDTLAACFNTAKSNLTVYPNPVPRGNAITITARLDRPGTYSIQLFNISGTLLESVPASGEQTSGTVRLTVPATLPPGAYIIRLTHPLQSNDYTQQIIVL